MIYRNVEESLHLLGVEVHGEDAVYARGIQQSPYQLGCNRHTGLILSILVRVSKNGITAVIRTCTGTPRCVHHDRITAVIPFFGYARQDRKDQPRVPITAKLVANLLYASGVNRVLTMDLHAQQVQGFFDIPVDHLYSLPVLIKYLRKELKSKTTVVSPDLGGLKMASAYAEALRAGLAIVAKERRSATETEALYLIGEVEGRDILLVDDLTETAGTLTSAAELLKKRGAKKIYAGVSHAVLVDIAIERLQKSQIAELVTTNSTPVRAVKGFKTTVLCVSELLGEGIKRIHNDESVSSLFNIEDGTNGKTG